METAGNTSSPLQLVAAPGKARQIASYLEQQIRAGAMTPGDRLQSVRNLAQQFGVSSKAVFSACELLEAQGLVVREQGRGVFVAPEAQATQSASFAVLTSFREHDIEGYFEALYAGLHEQNALCTPVLYGDKLPWRQMIAALQQQSLAGIFVDVGLWADLHKIQAAAGQTPICFVHRWQWDQAPEGPAVLVDFSGMYEKAFRYLQQRGHQRIAFVGPHDQPRIEYARHAREGAAAVGLTFAGDDLPYFGRPDFQADLGRILDVFGQDDRPTALVSVNDHNVALFRDQLERACPQCTGIEAIGAYDTSWSRQPGREFHSFRIDYAGIWRSAVAQMMELPSPSEAVQWVEAEFVERDHPHV